MSFGNSNFGFSGGGSGGGGGTITGGGTLNYVALFSPIGTNITDSIMSQDVGATYVHVAGDLLIQDNKNIDVENAGSKILNIGLQNAEVINIGTGLTPKVINVGSMTTLLDDINIYGNIFNQEVTNLLVKDKLFTVNDGGAVASGFNAGFQIDEGGSNTGWFMTNATRDGWDFKAPAITGVATLGLDLLTANRTAKIQDASGTIAYLSDITGAVNGTLNYVAMFTPDGNHVGNGGIKFGSLTTRALPINGGTNSIAIGYDSTLSGTDNYSYGYGLSVNGTKTFIYGHDVSIDDTSTTYVDGNIFSFGQLFTITGGVNVDSVVNLGFANTLTITSETRDVYILGDSHILTDFVTYSTLIGESCNFTRVDHTTAIGIFTNITDSTFIYTFGEGSSFSDSNTITNFGTYNTISSSTNLTIVGNGNTITDSDKLYLGNNNKNVVIDGITGYVGIGITAPTASLHVVGTDATLANYALKVEDNIFNDLFNVRNDGFVGINSIVQTATLERFQVNGVTKFRDGAWWEDEGLITFSSGTSFNIYAWNNDLILSARLAKDIIFTNNGAETARISSVGDMSVGVATAEARFHAYGVNASGINQRLEPVAGVREDVSGATVNTTDATTTTIYTVAIPTNKVVMVEARITARKTSGGGVGAANDGNGYVRTATYANIAGVVTLSGAVQASYTGEGIAPFNVTLTISGTNVLVQVSGAASDNVTWNCIVRTYEV